TDDLHALGDQPAAAVVEKRAVGRVDHAGDACSAAAVDVVLALLAIVLGAAVLVKCNALIGMAIGGRCDKADFSARQLDVAGLGRVRAVGEDDGASFAAQAVVIASHGEIAAVDHIGTGAELHRALDGEAARDAHDLAIISGGGS